MGHYLHYKRVTDHKDCGMNDCNENVEPKICEAAWRFFYNRPHQCVIEYISRAGLWDVVRVLPFQPIPVGDIDEDELLMPYGMKWTRGLKHNTEVHHALVPIRDQLDNLTSEQLYDEALVWILSLETSERGAEIANDIRRIFDQANQAFQGPTVPDEHYQ
ncbi:hypothetical protein BC332_21207 [Capsicum chinense]|nr:hypothetical protein BC332_21207 [Capsicum chinense]